MLLGHGALGLRLEKGVARLEKFHLRDEALDDGEARGGNRPRPPRGALELGQRRRVLLLDGRARLGLSPEGTVLRPVPVPA